MKIIMLKGLPGSGKSTWAKQFIAENPGWVRVNKDLLREMMGSYQPGEAEELILTWRDEAILAALIAERNVVVDDTNFHPKHEQRLRCLLEMAAITRKTKGEFQELKFDTPLAECIKNDLKRPNSVGEKVIRKMWREFLAPKQKVQNWTVGLQKAIIVDIDGTVALHVARGPYDVEKCGTDAPNKPVVALVKGFFEEGYEIIFVSGREDKYRDLTVKWFADVLHVQPGAYQLFMRPTGDNREDSIVKQELYEAHIKGKYNVFAVFDDRNRVVEMWRRNGLTCFQVAEGEF